MYICTKYLATFLYISRIVSGFTNIVIMAGCRCGATETSKCMFIKAESINIRILSSATVVLR